MLQDTLRKVIADAYVLYFKAHSYHWNIEGPNFPQYHEFLSNFYEDVFGSIDALAELIRTLDAYAPTTLRGLLDRTELSEADSIPSAIDMMTMLRGDNDIYLASLVRAYDEAEKASEFGISNYLQDRIQAHEKHAWMFRSIVKRSS